MYRVKGVDPRGHVSQYACGTDEQALEKTWELARRGFRDIIVFDPVGEEFNAVSFEKTLDIDYD